MVHQASAGHVKTFPLLGSSGSPLPPLTSTLFLHKPFHMISHDSLFCEGTKCIEPAPDRKWAAQHLDTSGSHVRTVGPTSPTGPLSPGLPVNPWTP